MTNCCLGCKNRFVGCHSKCTKYIALTTYNSIQKRKKEKENLTPNELMGIMISRTKRNTGKMSKHYCQV